MSKAAASKGSGVPSSSSTLPERVSESYVYAVACMEESLDGPRTHRGPGSPKGDRPDAWRRRCC